MRKARKWTLEEKQYLEDNWGTLSIGTIAKNLSRSRNAIEVMKNRLGLGAFLDNGDYVTMNQLLVTLGIRSGGYKKISWIQNRNFPVHKKRVGTNSFKVVYLEEFWEWAEKNRDLLDFSKFEENILGIEPEWAKEKRRHDVQKNRKYITTPWTAAEDQKLIRLLNRQKYSYEELSRELRRTNGAIYRRIYTLGLKDRPIKADNHIKWAEEELRVIGEMIKAGNSYEAMAERIGKSTKAIRGRVYAMYLTENLDKARALIGTGSWGDNRPERLIKHRNVMSTQEKAETQELLIRFTTTLRHEFKEQLDQTEWGEFFQKDMCQNFGGECLKTSGCDECENFVRIRPQNCKMCGKTFYERQQNNFCHSCRDMRRKQYLRKKMLLGRSVQ